MDGVSAAAAVIGLVQAAAQVATLLGKYISSVKNADSARAKLLDQIRLISTAETTIESIVRNASPSLRAPALQALIGEWFKENGTPSKCKAELEELASWLESQRETKGHKRWVKMLSWPTKEDRIQATIRAFEGYMPYFRDVLSIETFNLVESIATRHNKEQVSGAKSKLLSWLDGFDCTDKQESTLRQRQETTGEWLLKEKLYLDWHNGLIDFIWLHGKAGAGKSVLASVLIDTISHHLEENEAFAYFYCDFRNSRCTNASEVLRSIVKQLLWNSRSDWLSSFSELTARMERGARPPADLDTLLDLLRRAAELHERPIVLVDALDECEDLSKLLDQLTKLSHGRCRLFVTSRTLHHIKEAFIDLPSISLDERVDEVREDMFFHIKTELQSRSRLKTLGKDLKDEIQDALMKKADGMFRWVQCQLDRLNNCWSMGDVREVLATLPRTLYDTYDRMIKVIEQAEFGPRIARKALSWLALALDPLKLSQLAEALAMNLDVLNAPMHWTDILEICGSLVTLNEDTGIITLSHYSVKEYLTSDAAPKPYFVHFPLGSFEIVSTSINAVMLYTDTTHGNTLTYDRFCYYAVRSGFRHLAGCSSDHNEVLANNLLSLQDHVSAYRSRHTGDSYGQFDSWLSEIPQLALYIITRFGHLSILKHYLDSHPVEVTEEDNPLVYAALYSDHLRVQLYLDHALNVDAEGPIYDSLYVYRMSPLSAAARNQTSEYQEPLVRLILARHCFVSKYVVHSVLLCRAGTPPKPAVFRTLLDHGADPTLLVAGRKSALHLLLEHGELQSEDDLAVACMLVTAGCDPLATDDRGFSPFGHAINAYGIEWIHWLLQNGFQMPPDAVLQMFPKGTSLSKWSDTLRMMLFLIQKGVDFRVHDAEGCNALHRLARFGLINQTFMAVAVPLLLDHGCDIEWKNEAGETPLHLVAAHHVWPGGIDLLVGYGAQLPIDIVNYSVTLRTRPFVPYLADFLIPLVKGHGASCQSTTLHGENALHSMLKIDALLPDDSLPIAKFLLENGCEIHATNSFGATSLQLAIENGHLSTAELILSQLSQSSVDPPPSILPATDPEGNEILHRLCRKLRGDWRIEMEEFVGRLLMMEKVGYDPTRDVNRRNHQGFTPLCIVLGANELTPASAGDPIVTVISVLLHFGASFSEVTPLYRDNFDWATNLPWYHDATEAYRLLQSRFNPCFGDVAQVYYLLQLAHSRRIPPHIARLIVNMAEYWAQKKVVKKAIRRTIRYKDVQIALPALPHGSFHWIPRRVTFSCKPRVVRPRIHSRVRIGVLVRRSSATFEVPVRLHPAYVPPHPPKTVFDVWDASTAATRPNAKGRLAVAELTPEDSFDVEFGEGSDDYFELEFFQVEVLYAIDPTST